MLNLGTNFFHRDVGFRRRGIETWVTAMLNLGTNFFHRDVGFRRRGIETAAPATEHAHPQPLWLGRAIQA
jgi:hypothetical protein